MAAAPLKVCIVGSGNWLPCQISARLCRMQTCWCLSFPTSSFTESVMRSLGECPRKRWESPSSRA
ncbi:GPD1L isoform 3 [Pan troglodytes]|uniref:GPD1L isoform 3 n=1 Tax=Pan troglodytes TaxID=9598 RepID=A0A2J8NPV5_PANTR|nr:GPD1L isoform 3 [Pan troglodytes]